MLFLSWLCLFSISTCNNRTFSHSFNTRFQNEDDELVNLMPEFALTFWLRYMTQMNGRPEPQFNSSQLVLKYLLLNEKKLHTAWRNRIYRFSSGTTFAKITRKLTKHLRTTGRPVQLRDVRAHVYIPFVHVYEHQHSHMSTFHSYMSTNINTDACLRVDGAGRRALQVGCDRHV